MIYAQIICKFKNKPYLCLQIKCGIPILGEESEFLIFFVLPKRAAASK